MIVRVIAIAYRSNGIRSMTAVAMTTMNTISQPTANDEIPGPRPCLAGSSPQ
jgi:hypothetical protein